MNNEQELLERAIKKLKDQLSAIADDKPIEPIVTDINNYFKQIKLDKNVNGIDSIRALLTELEAALNNLQNNTGATVISPSPSVANNTGSTGTPSSSPSVVTPAIQQPRISASIIDDDVITYIEVLDAGTDPFGSKINKKVSAFILPCPSNLMDLHSVNFEGRDFGTANYQLNTAAGATSRYDMGGAMAGRFMDYAGKRVQYTLGGLNNDYLAEHLNILGRKGDDLGYDVYSVGKGVAINPNTELVFRGVNIREFQLNWKLINFGNKIHFQLTKNGRLVGKSVVPPPPSGNTSIVTLLLQFYYEARKLMYPEVDQKFASGYPAKFAITVRKNNNPNVASFNTREILVSIGNGRLNRNGEKMGCYIKDLQLDYIPSDSSFGASISSYPTVVLENGDFQEISLSMTVQEAALLNRKSITQMYS